MGNSLPLPCVCKGANDEVASTAGARRSRKKKKKKTAGRTGRAAPRHVVPVDTPEESGDGDEQEDEREITAAWPGCRVAPDGGGVRVTIVMKRKEAEELVTRLERRDAAERKTRMEELSAELGAAGTVMSPCRDSWRPRLASITEH